MGTLANVKKRQSLDLFAKLLAQENLRVVISPSARTAAMDVANRRLILPVWEQFQDDDVRELFRGHECAHALFTPAAGWHDVVNKKFAHRQTYRAIVNILEDVRIESALKRRFPGFKQVMLRGYKALFENGFFGKTDGKLNLADRINLHFKLGQLVDIQFKPTELDLIKQIELMTTWDDVLNMADKVFELVKEEELPKDRMFKNTSNRSGKHHGGSSKRRGGNADAQEPGTDDVPTDGDQEDEEPEPKEKTPSERVEDDKELDKTGRCKTDDAFREALSKVENQERKEMPGVFYVNLFEEVPDSLTRRMKTVADMEGHVTRSVLAQTTRPKILETNIDFDKFQKEFQSEEETRMVMKVLKDRGYP